MPDMRGVTSCSYVRHHRVRRDSRSGLLHHCLAILRHPPLPQGRVWRTHNRKYERGVYSPVAAAPRRYRKGLRAVTPAMSSMSVIMAEWSHSPRPAYCTAWNNSLTTAVTGNDTLSLRAMRMA